MADNALLVLDVRACAPALVITIASDRPFTPTPPFSENPESWFSCLSSTDFADAPLCLCVLPITSKKATGTRPLAVGMVGLQASYQSGSSSLLTTWKKSPLLNGSSWGWLGSG